MKRVVSIMLAAACLLCGCGNKAEEEKSHIIKRPGVIATAVPESDTIKDTATALPQGTLAPLEDSSEVTEITAQEVPNIMEENDFTADVPQGHKRYTAGDGSWGIEIPADAEIEDQSERSAMFKIGDNILTAVIVDKFVRLETVSQAKAQYADFGDIAIKDFSVIRDGGEYRGCFFEFLMEGGIRGFAKYVTDGEKTVSAASVNMTMDAAQGEILKEAVNSLVIFE